MTRAIQLQGITFCIPNWNHRNFLARSISTAISAGRELEALGAGCQILVIDDGSRDGSQRLLLAMALADPTGLIDVVVTPKNRGLAATRNAGLEHSLYGHICFMDADNELIPENMPLFWRAVQATGAAVIFGNLLRQLGDDIEGLISNDFIDEHYLNENYVDAFAIYDVAKLRLCGGFNEGMTSHEDWEMLLHILAEDEDVVFVPLCMGYYHVVPHSMLKTEVFDHSTIYRRFNQRKSGFPGLKSRRKVFHPDLGWLINDGQEGLAAEPLVQPAATSKVRADLAGLAGRENAASHILNEHRETAFRPGWFDVAWYLSQNEDVREAKYDPYEHYLAHGRAEGRPPNPMLQRLRGGIVRPPLSVDPLSLARMVEAIEASGLFDVTWYASKYFVEKSDAIKHYVTIGAFLGMDPSPFFQGLDYWTANPDVMEAASNPFLHYIEQGFAENRRLSANSAPEVRITVAIWLEGYHGFG